MPIESLSLQKLRIVRICSVPLNHFQKNPPSSTSSPEQTIKIKFAKPIPEYFRYSLTWGRLHNKNLLQVVGPSVMYTNPIGSSRIIRMIRCAARAPEPSMDWNNFLTFPLQTQNGTSGRMAWFILTHSMIQPIEDPSLLMLFCFRHCLHGENTVTKLKKHEKGGLELNLHKLTIDVTKKCVYRVLSRHQK